MCSGIYRNNPPQAKPYINPETDHFISLIIANVSSLGNKKSNVMAHYIEIIMFAVSLKLYSVFESRKYIGGEHRYLPMIQNFHHISTLMETITRSLAMSAIEQKIATRRKVAELLGVHENTVSRWFKEHQDRSIGGHDFGKEFMALTELKRSMPELDELLKFAQENKTPALEVALAALHSLSNEEHGKGD